MNDEYTQDANQIPADDVATGAEAPVAVDYAAIEERLKKVDPSFSLSTVADRVEEMRRGYSKQGQELYNLKQKYQSVDPLLQEVEKNQAFREYLETSIKDFYQGSVGQYQQYPGYGAPPDMSAAFDPVKRKVDDLETRLQVMRMEGEISELKSKGFDVTDDRREAIIRRVLETGWGNARDHYMALFGEDEIRKREEAAARSTGEAIRKNASVAPQPAGSRPPSANASKPDPRTMTEAEFDAYAMTKWMNKD